MNKLILVFTLLFSVPTFAKYTGKTDSGSKITMKTMCIEGVEYYRLKERSGGSMSFSKPRGFAYLTPVVDSETLKFKRCDMNTFGGR